MIRESVFIVLMFLLFFCLAAESLVAAPFDELKEACGKSLQKLDERVLASRMDFVSAYRKDLEKMEEAAKNKGDLDGVMAVKEERKLLDEAKGIIIPEDESAPTAYAGLKELRKKYNSFYEKMESGNKIEAEKIYKNYITGMEAMKVLLTKDGKFEEALAVKAEIEKVLKEQMSSGDGEKKVEDKSETKCPACNGAGVVEEACSVCKGTGLCRMCNGEGFRPGLSNFDRVTCLSCKKTGKCRDCEGTGRARVKCPKCSR